MSTFWIALALKATLWTAAISMAVWMIPAQHPKLRRACALLGLWGVWIVPWLKFPTAGINITATAWEVVEVRTRSGSWMNAVVAAWVLGSLILLLRLLREHLSIARLVQSAKPQRICSATSVEVRVSAEIEGPCMTGWWRPCVLLPLEALAWPAATLQAALRHEEQHARQHDGLHRVCTALLQAVFWWSPAVHLLCRIYEEESEVCCDFEASSRGVNRRQYGEMLLAHAMGTPARALAIPFARRAGLRGRIGRLLATSRPAHWMSSTRWCAALLLLMAAGMLVAAVRIDTLEVPPTPSLESEARLRLSADPFPAGH
ncbi:MAG: M56 family metallopeptidase [Prosthecobacter sp.]